MSKSIHREINRQIRAEQRMKAQIGQAREKALQQAEEYISGLYADGQESIDFRFDAFQLWGKGVGAEEVFKFLREQELYTDDWLRSVFSLSKEQAIELNRRVEEWNTDWEEEVARHYDVDQACYRHAYHISFSPASGTEHTISVGRYFTTSWQWN